LPLDVSVVIPVRNGARHVAEAIESCLAQTRAPAEIIVVDDGSEDDTAARVEAFRADVTLLRQSWQGAAAAMNHGLTHARAPLTAFLDHDDTWARDKLRTQLELFDGERELEAAFCFLQQYVSPEVEAETAVLYQCPQEQQSGICASAMLIRREAFDRYGVFTGERNASAFLRWHLRAQAAGLRFAVAPQTLVMRRLHPNNSGRTQPEWIRDYYIECARERILSRRVPKS
jgi:glycosyltransferase involved in cell wall biosynthesis